ATMSNRLPYTTLFRSKERCSECRGQGRLEREKTIELRIPPGVDTGTRLRVGGEGEPGPNGGPAGDLYVVLDVKEHPFFERRGARSEEHTSELQSPDHL